MSMFNKFFNHKTQERYIKNMRENRNSKFTNKSILTLNTD